MFHFTYSLATHSLYCREKMNSIPGRDGEKEEEQCFRQLASFSDYGIRLWAHVLARWRAISTGAMARSGPNAIISGDKPAKVK